MRQGFTPGLIADSPVGLYEFSDLTIIDEKHLAYGTMTGRDVHNYLQKYAEKYDLIKKIKFESEVETARRKGRAGL